MRRLLTTMRLDLRLQWRYGLIFAAGFMLLVWVVLLRAVPTDLLTRAIPFALFADLAMVGFYFVAGAVLFEKDERTLYALVITPLRFTEYLAAKLFTLTLLAVVTCLIVVIAVVGTGFHLLWLLLGVTLCSLIGLLVGFIAVAPFQSISEYILPSGLLLLPLGLPLVDYLDLWPSPIWYLFPTQGALILLRGAFMPVAPWQLAYAIGYQLLWIGVLVWVARRAFRRYILVQGG